MPFVPIENAWRVALNGTFNVSNHPWAMVFGVNDTHDHDLARAIDLAEVFADWWHDHLAAQTTTRCQLNMINVLDQADETGVSVNYVSGLPHVGTSPGDPSASQVSVMVTLLTGMRGRANRGRKFVPGSSSAWYDTGDGTALEAGEITAYNTAFAALLTAILALSGGPTLAVLSYSQALAIPVLAVQTRTWLGTQRSRSAV